MARPDPLKTGAGMPNAANKHVELMAALRLAMPPTSQHPTLPAIPNPVNPASDDPA